MPKDALLYARLQQLGLAGRTFRPEPPSPNTLALAHDPAYVRSFLDGSISPAAMRRIGLPWSEALVRRALVGVGSAVLAARLALQFGVAVMCNGGTHHAHPAHGSGKPWRQGGVGRGGSQRRAGGSPCLPGGSSMPAPAGPAAPPPPGSTSCALNIARPPGWCIFNDQAVAARAAQRDAGIGQVLFVDLDVHQVGRRACGGTPPPSLATNHACPSTAELREQDETCALVSCAAPCFLAAYVER